jgi:hypothetical protein
MAEVGPMLFLIGRNKEGWQVGERRNETPGERVVINRLPSTMKGEN